jgi:hypothetical protein
MTKTAAVRFSGICTHLTNTWPAAHQVMLPDVSNPETYAGIPRLAGLPPHTARLIVNQKNLANREEVLDGPGTLAFEATGNSWSWVLRGVQITIALAPQLLGSPPVPPQRLQSAPTWRKDVPSLHHYAPLATGQDRPLAQPVEARAAAMIDIRWGDLVPVNFDARSGGTGVDWTFAVGERQVKVTFTSLATGQPVPMTLLLNVPDRACNGPVEPLIQIENVGTAEDDDLDFLFHYYALFAFVPENATPPRNVGLVESGIGAGCSNSSYP